MPQLKPSTQNDEIGNLYNLASKYGEGKVAQKIITKAQKPKTSFISKILDFVQRPNFAIATGIKNVLDTDQQTKFWQGIGKGLSGKSKTTFSEVLGEIGWQPKTIGGKIARGATGLTLDILLDPTTYLTFGVGTGAKIGGKTLTKAGTQFLAKAAKTGAGETLGREFVGEAMKNLMEKNPLLAKKFLDQGGVKFFSKTLLSSQRIKEAMEVLPGIKPLETLLEPVRNAALSLIKPEYTLKYGKLPPEFTTAYQKFKDSTSYLKNIKFQELENIVRTNKLNSNELELLQNAAELGKIPADKRLATAYQQLIGYGKRQLKETRKAGIPLAELKGQGEVKNWVPRILVDEPIKTTLPYKPIKVRTGFAEQRGVEVEKTIKQINEDFGKTFFEPNYVKSLAARQVKINQAITAKEFLNDVVSKFGTKIGEAPSGFIAVKEIKELDGLVFHPAIAEQLTKFKKGIDTEEASNLLLSYFDKLQNYWKATVTSIFLSFHGRNALSNTVLNFWDLGAQSFNPATNALAIDLIRRNAIVENLERKVLSDRTIQKELNELLAVKIFTDKFSNDYTFGTLRNLIKQNNIAFTGEFRAADLPQNIEKMLGLTPLRKKIIPLYSQNYLFEAGKTVGSVVEGQARILNFLSNLKKTGDPLTAAERTKQFLFDYQNLTDFEKNFMRRIIPFYTFARKNLEMHAVQSLKQPGKLATTAKFIKELGKTATGGQQLNEEEIEALPEWAQKGLNIPISKKSGFVALMESIGLPIENIKQVTDQPLTMLSPLLGVPLQFATGLDFFREKPITENIDGSVFRHAPEVLKKFIGYRKIKKTTKDGQIYYQEIALYPKRLFLLTQLPPTSRIFSVIKQFQNTQIPTGAKVLQQITGLKTYPFNLEAERAKRERELKTQLEDLLINLGKMRRYQNVYEPKNQ